MTLVGKQWLILFLGFLRGFNMWQALAGLALNIGKKNKAAAEESNNFESNIINEQEQITQQNAQRGRDLAQQQILNINNQRGNNTQQQVFDEIMKKYNVRL